MVDDPNDPTDDMDAGPGPYPQHYDEQQPAFTTGAQGFAMTMAAAEGLRAEAQASFGQMFDPSDPSLDADPFGLTASMHFPTPFSFQESSMRK